MCEREGEGGSERESTERQRTDEQMLSDRCSRPSLVCGQQDMTGSLHTLCEQMLCTSLPVMTITLWSDTKVWDGV